MYDLLVKLMFAAALAQLGLAAWNGGHCPNRTCSTALEKGSRNILRIDWKPISVFPEEAKRFR